MLRPVVISPATPSELLSYIVTRQRYPTTLLIGSSKEDFLSVLVQDVQLQQQQHHEVDEQEAQQQQPSDGRTSSSAASCHPLLRASLLQVAVSRHINTVFIPTVTHLQAYLSTFTSHSDSKTPPPPPPPPTTSTSSSNSNSNNPPPLLLVYGFLELHRDSLNWSAQGLGSSLAAMVECAAGTSLRPVIAEPRADGRNERLDQIRAERVPLLGGAAMQDDGTWSGRTVELGRVLGRWFEFDEEMRMEKA